MYRIKIIAALIITFSCFIYPQETAQTFLTLKSTGVEEFLSHHPDYDGRGTIIFVLDTGVDMGIDGLTKTSEGKTKVIDCRDFTGEGNLPLYKADVSGNNFVNENMHYSVKGADKIKSKDGKFFIGAIKEIDFINSVSGSADLNGNGKKDDVYLFVVYVDDKGDWTSCFDTNCNGDLSDEKPVKDYHINFDTFKIENIKSLTPFTFAVNIFPDQNLISLHFDDGSHGTHVSGIASGYMVDGSKLNGVAPGANVISLKIGNNNYPGGATVTGSMKNAFLCADSISKQRKEPCVLNMSFGIGSEIEGASEMEIFLGRLLKENPYLYVCLGNANDGPGLSTTGLPSCSDYVFSSGAVLNSDIARDLYGAPLTRDIIFPFSGRGGEVNKPDVVSPGACVSTVPNFSTHDMFQGTSMASPYSAGVMSLLLSAFAKEHPDLKLPSQLLFKIVRESAVKMDGYTYLDQGSGYINVQKAYDLMKKYISAGELKNYERYTVSSFAPGMPGNEAPNLYLRDGSYLSGKETFHFNVNRNNFQKVKNFFRVYNLSSDCNWLLPVQKKTYIRNDQTAIVNVSIDKSKLKSPGLYCGKIKAFRDDKSQIPEFDMIASVIIPYEFTSSDDYKHEWKKENVDPGILNRYFIKLPAGQTMMNVNLSSIKGEYALIRYRLCSPEGNLLETSPYVNTVSNNNIVDKNYYNLDPGVYELIVEGMFTASSVCSYDLAVSFNSIQRTDNNPLNLVDKNIDLVNFYNHPLTFNVKGRISGYMRTFKADLVPHKTFLYPVTLKKGESEKEFEIVLSKEDFNKVTDFTYEIIDSSGFAVEQGALDYRKGKISLTSLESDKSDKYNLILIPGFTNASDSMTVTINEESFFDKSKVFGLDGASATITLYPSITNRFTFDYSKPEVEIPADAVYKAKLQFQSGTKTMDELLFTIDQKDK